MSLRAAIDSEFRTWHEVLRDLAYPQVYVPDWRLREEHTVLWLHCERAQHETIDKEETEAVELLAHLALADWKLCRKHMLEIWGGIDCVPSCVRSATSDRSFILESGFSMQLEAVLTRGPFQIGLQLYLTVKDDDPMELAHMTEYIVTRDHIESSSEDYQSLSSMIAELPRRNASRVERSLHVPVCLRQSQGCGFVHNRRLLAQTLHIALAQNHFQRQHISALSTGRLRLQIDRIEFRNPMNEGDELAQLKYLRDLHRQGVCCVNGSELCFDSPAAESTINNLQTFLATDKTHSKADGCEKQDISTVVQDDWLVPLFSAIYASTSLRELRIVVDCPREDDDMYDVDKFWSWFALAVLKRRAPIGRLELCVGTDEEDVDALRRACAIPDLLFEMVHHRATSSTSCESPFVDASKFSITDVPSLERLITTDRIQHGLPVAHRSGDWLRVLLPGWGPAWVHQDTATVSSLQAGLARPPIEQLVLPPMIAEQFGPALELIRLIGRDIRQLDVEKAIYSSTFQGSEWFSQMFSMCPHLEELRIRSIDFADTSTLVACYRSGVCRVKRLTLYRVGVHPSRGAEPDRVLPVILSALQDSQHAITQCLDELTCISGHDHPPSAIDMLDTALEMLEANTNLQKLHLEFPEMQLQSLHHEKYLQDFASHDRKPLFPRDRALAMKRKVAFLSVTAAREGAAQRLDSVVISSVFQFAATCEKRRVVVHIPPRNQRSRGTAHSP